MNIPTKCATVKRPFLVTGANKLITIADNLAPVRTTASLTGTPDLSFDVCYVIKSRQRRLLRELSFSSCGYALRSLLWDNRETF
jgi:hypothetical protein